MNSALSSARQEYVQWFIEKPFSFWVTLTFRQSTKSIQSVDRYCQRQSNFDPLSDKVKLTHPWRLFVNLFIRYWGYPSSFLSFQSITVS